MSNSVSPTVTLLGTGTSTGVPVLGCDCDVCQSNDPRDKRTRCSCYIRVNGLGLLIDTGPDFRAQAMREDIDRVDAVLYTHHHFDHVVGIDDLRPFFFQNRRLLPCYTSEETEAVLRRNKEYIFRSEPYPGAPNLELRRARSGQAFRVVSRYENDASVRVTPIEAYHGELPVLGYRVGDFAYLTDINRIPDRSWAHLQDLDVLVLDALRPTKHRTHFSFDEAVDVAQRLDPRQTYFIHMTHNALHAEACAALPDGIDLGYDGLTFECSRTPAAPVDQKSTS